MRLPPIIPHLFTALILLTQPAGTAINGSNLGASFDPAGTNVIFRIYSSRATQIRVDLYSSPMGSPEVLNYTLMPDGATGIFSISIPLAAVRAAGITGPIYYGYRAWGPNRPFSTAWTKVQQQVFVRMWMHKAIVSIRTNFL